MKKYVKTIGLTAALAVAIPLSAYAAASASTPAADGAAKAQTQQSADSAMRPGFGHGDRGGRGGFGGQFISDDVLTLLKLDRDTLQQKLAAGSTLAEIAAAQGVSADSLKAALTKAFDDHQAQEKEQFTANLDTMISSKQNVHPEGGPGFGIGHNLSAVAKALGLTEDELHTELQKDGATIATIAKAKGVSTETLISAVQAAIDADIDQAVTDGKLTADQAATMKKNSADQAKNIVNGNGDFGHRGGFGGRFGGGPRGGMGGPAVGGAPSGGTSASTPSSGSTGTSA